MVFASTQQKVVSLVVKVEPVRRIPALVFPVLTNAKEMQENITVFAQTVNVAILHFSVNLVAKMAYAKVIPVQVLHARIYAMEVLASTAVPAQAVNASIQQKVASLVVQTGHATQILV
jgi:hypothetical protein